MEPEPEVTFLFQFGNVRDTQRMPLAALNLKSLKDLACDFINEKVNREIGGPTKAETVTTDE